MIVVLGLGRETRELLRVLDSDAARLRVLVLEEATAASIAPPGGVDHLDVEVVGGVSFDDPDLLPREATAIYRSPGVSPYRPALATARARDIPMTTPTGWWAAQRDGTSTIALTGTKGKSTTAALTAHLLRAAGRTVALLGNIGQPALTAGPEVAADDVVLELSSYQLVDLDGRFGLGGMTTLLRDHVPWHGSLERYHADKLRLLDLVDRRIVTAQVAAQVDPTRVDALPCPASSGLRAAVAAAGVVGEHFVEDAALALALVDARLGRPGGVTDLVEALAGFEPLPHRMTPVADIAGRMWVDDSISTVPESAVAAARAYLDRGPVTLLLGGDDRGQDLAPLVELFADARVTAVLLPPLGDRLFDALSRVAAGRLHQAQDLAEAVAVATEVAPVGGSVVLSPAAPSFGSYRDFVARGEHFVALVTALPRK